jgi:cytidylate kinase
MIVTIDGPAGAGKSTVAKRLARRLGFEYLDTGAMYRAVALLGLRHQVDWNRPDLLLELAEGSLPDARAGRTYLGEEEVTDAVRSEQVTQHTRFAADHPGVRQLLVRRQREISRGRDIVTEGRDQGSLVFPRADCKIFLTATPPERARRRQGEIEKRGERADYQKILDQIRRRDHRDSRREVGPLVMPEDAVEVVTDGMSIEEVVQRLVEIVSRCRKV